MYRALGRSGDTLNLWISNDWNGRIKKTEKPHHKWARETSKPHGPNLHPNLVGCIFTVYFLQSSYPGEHCEWGDVQRFEFLPFSRVQVNQDRPMMFFTRTKLGSCWKICFDSEFSFIPTASMYGIFTYIRLKLYVNLSSRIDQMIKQ